MSWRGCLCQAHGQGWSCQLIRTKGAINIKNNFILNKSQKSISEARREDGGTVPFDHQTMFFLWGEREAQNEQVCLWPLSIVRRYNENQSTGHKMFLITDRICPQSQYYRAWLKSSEVLDFRFCSCFVIFTVQLSLR